MKIETALEKKRDLENSIKSVNRDLANIPQGLPFNMSLYEWQGRLDTLMHKHKNDMESILKKDKGYYHLVKENIEKIATEAQRRKDLDRKARAELTDLHKKLEALDLQLSIKELLALQDKAVILQKHIDGLNQAVASEKGKINETEHKINRNLEALTEARENLLADTASGVFVDSGRVEELDKQIAQAEAEHEKSVDSMLTGSHTISGLNRKIEKAVEDLLLAKSNFNDAATLFLKGEIDKAGSAYVDLAEKLSAKFLRIVSMASICETLGNPVNVMGPYLYKFQIPSFALDACQAKENSDMAGLLFRFASVNRQEAIKTELEHFAGLGLKFAV